MALDDKCLNRNAIIIGISDAGLASEYGKRFLSGTREVEKLRILKMRLVGLSKTGMGIKTLSHSILKLSLAASIYCVCLERNSRVFTKKSYSPAEIVEKIERDVGFR